MERILSVRAIAAPASARSTWTFAEVTTNAGRVGTGEGSLSNSGMRVRDRLERLAINLIGQPADPGLAVLSVEGDKDLVEVSAKCAVSQALSDVRSQAAGRSIASLLCPAPRTAVEAYANINRRTRDRSPDGFARSIGEGLAGGFEAVKIAPFDNLGPDLDAVPARPLLAAGYARIAAVRDRLGPDRKLMVDCHERLAGWMLDEVLQVCAANQLFWLEMPFPETPEMFGEIRKARARANALGIRLAGAELRRGLAGFGPVIEAEIYDVIMPDMTFAGGHDAVMRIAERAQARGLQVAPHNPWGPICHGHSVQISAAVPGFLILEAQFDETPLFQEIVDGQPPQASGGMIQVPTAPGLQLRLNRAVADALDAQAAG